MAPPITRLSTRFTRFSNSSILVETLAPPTTAISVRSGLTSAFSRWVSSACIERPAALGRSLATPSVLAWARWAALNASLTKMSPSAASCLAIAGSLSSSPLWKRVFSNNSTWPSFSAATALSATGPIQLSAKATGRPIASASGAASGFSDIDGTTLPLGRSKWLSTITRAPFSASSRMVGAWRTIRSVSVTLPSAIGTLRSARTRTRFDFTSRSSSVRKDISDQLAHRHGGVGHAAGETPFIVVPAHHRHEGAVHHLGLVQREAGGGRIVVEVHRDQLVVHHGQDALPGAHGRALDSVVDLRNAGRPFGHKLQVHQRDIGRGHAH